MITKFGSSVNGVKIAFQYEDFEYSKDGKYARITRPRVVIVRDVNIVDHKNLLTVSGSVFLKQKDQKANLYRNLSCSGSGRKTIQRLIGEWVPLDSDKSIRKQFRISLEGLEYVGEPLIVAGYITYPPSNPN